MKLFKLAACLLAAALAGCAHPLTITPNLAKLERDGMTPPRIKAKVGYYIADNLRSQEVTTPGGGGDKATSAPYRDVEAGLYIMLGNVFDGVTRLNSPSDRDAIRSNGISYIITPEILASSSSSSVLTWPPTEFHIDLLCKITDLDGKLLDSPKVVGHGQAEWAEFKGDFALSGKRAAEDALVQMQRKLLAERLAPQAPQTAAQ
ncbi:MAG TPA: hypothetical protein VFG03_07780 [Telluria sp.]|nr:hypothetical protein [Telluria sp.]